MIHGEENVEFGFFGGDKKVAVLETGESGVTGGLAVVARQPVPESLIDALVDQNAHLFKAGRAKGVLLLREQRRPIHARR
jgi:hypothetical protein